MERTSSRSKETGDPKGRFRVGIVGAGMIATAPYGFLPGLRRLADTVEVAAITSRTKERAEALAHDWQIPTVYDDLASMLRDDSLDAVINLTPISAHYETSMSILEAGKHLVTEKPLASSMTEADDICELAERKACLVMCAPIDMLRPEWVEARRLVQSGALGTVAFARAHASHAGPAAQSWPVDPSWFYQRGAGPLLDMGVYGIDRLIGVLGPAQRVTAMSGITTSVRRARGGPYDGADIQVTADDNTLLLLDFGGSTFATLDATFNVVATRAAPMEVYGSEGSLVVRRPGVAFDQGQLPLELFRVDAAPGLSGWITPRSVGANERPDRAQTLKRAILVEHLIECIATGNPPVPGPARARHVLEVILAAQTAAQEGRTMTLRTGFAD